MGREVTEYEIELQWPLVNTFTSIRPRSRSRRGQREGLGTSPLFPDSAGLDVEPSTGTPSTGFHVQYPSGQGFEVN